MKKYLFHVGVDVSKSKLDVSILNSENRPLQQLVTKNGAKGFKEILARLKSLKANLEDVLFCFENTGVYSMPLNIFLAEKQLDYWEVPAIEIKRSKGLSRGKSDKTDARDIALYSIRNLDKLVLSSRTEVEILQLKLLFTEREKVKKAIRLFGSTSENEGFLPDSVYKAVKASNQKTVRQLKKTLKEIDQKLKTLVKQDEELCEQFKLLKSVCGIGDITAIYMIIATKGFKKFENWRKFACYSGIAPFEYSSGSSIRGKTKVNHFADKGMKTLLQMAALSAKKYDPELKVYYARKLEEGKNKMLIMNNIRCKLVSRAFSVIKRQTPYVKTHRFAA